MSKFLKTALIAAAALLALVFVSNVVTAPRRPAPPAPSVSVPARTPAPGEVTNYYTKRRIETAQILLERSFPNTWSVSWRYDNVNGWCFFDIVCPAIDSDFIRDAQDDVGTCRRDWDDVVKSVIDIQKSVQKIFTESEDDTVVVLDILNPKNEDEVFLSVANGVAGYDVVNEIDLFSEAS